MEHAPRTLARLNDAAPKERSLNFQCLERRGNVSLCIKYVSVTSKQGALKGPIFILNQSDSNFVAEEN